MRQETDRPLEYAWPNALACPVCGGEYLHQGAVTVYSRDREDAGGMIAAVQGVQVTVARVDDPSAFPGRRDSLTIEFTCENGCTATLMIMQHKGNTLCEWIKLTEATEDTGNE